MSKKNKKDNEQGGYRITSKKSGKSVKVTKKQANTAKRAAKAALKKMPRKKRLIVTAAAVVLLAVLVYIFDVAVLPLEYISVKFTKKNSLLGEREMKIHFLDIGQGDSIIIELPDRTNMIIDGGDRGNSVWKHILTYGEKLGIKTFDYMLLTHSDADHVGGFARVLDYFEVKNIYMPDIKPHNTLKVSSTYDKFVKAAQNETYKDEKGNTKKAEIFYTYASDMILTTDSVNEFFIAAVSPFKERYDTLNAALEKGNATAAQKNDVSAVLYLEYINVRALMTGDANIVVEDEIADKYAAGIYNEDLDGKGSMFTKEGKSYNVNLQDVDLYKAGHHGSRGSSGEKLLNLIKPKYTIISAGLDNSHGHPHKETMERLKLVNSTVYETSVGGDITASVKPGADGNGKLNFVFSKPGVYVTAQAKTDIAALYIVLRRAA